MTVFAVIFGYVLGMLVSATVMHRYGGRFVDACDDVGFCLLEPHDTSDRGAHQERRPEHSLGSLFGDFTRNHWKYHSMWPRTGCS